MTDRDPMDAMRALFVAMPLAILVGAIVAPPDPVTQFVTIFAALAVVWPLTLRYVVGRVDGPFALGGFFLVVFVVVLVGLWVVSQVGLTGGAAAAVARLLVVVAATTVAYGLVVERVAW